MRISDWSSDVCSSDLRDARRRCDIPRCSWRPFNLEADPETAQPVGQEHGVKVAGPPQDHVECKRGEPNVKPFAVGAERARAAEIGRESWRERGCQYV